MDSPFVTRGDTRSTETACAGSVIAAADGDGGTRRARARPSSTRRFAAGGRPHSPIVVMSRTDDTFSARLPRLDRRGAAMPAARPRRWCGTMPGSTIHLVDFFDALARANPEYV